MSSNWLNARSKHTLIEACDPKRGKTHIPIIISEESTDIAWALIKQSQLFL